MKKNCQVIAYNKISTSELNICKLLATVKENLSTLIQRRIRELGTTKAEVARQSGLSRTYITDLANGTGNTQSGQYNLSPESVSALAKALEITEAEILEVMNYLPKNGKQPKTKIEELAFHYPGIPEQRRDKVDYLIDLLDNEIKKIEAEKEKYGE